MLALNKKLFRELWHMKGQALAIGMVIAGGVGTFVMSLSVLHSLKGTQAAFYRDSRFADVFAGMKRAPESLRERIAEIGGVKTVATRVLSSATLDIEGHPDPVSAQIVSLPDHGEQPLNKVYLRRGRLPEPGRENEVVVNEQFADAHRLQPGAILRATIYGKRRTLEVCGIGLAPDYVYALPPGTVIPDFKSFGILWMLRKPLSAAADMEGAFNEVTLTLDRGERAEQVLDRLDELLARYGGQGAYSRKDQISHRYLSEEFKQLEQMARMFPLVFLAVASFLLNVVISRLIATQREQIAILKAFGYSTGAVAAHYLKLVVLVVLLGCAAGVGMGVLMGRSLGELYMDFYRFPFLIYELRPQVVVLAVTISAGAAVAGCLFSVLRAAAIAPAEAMQPAPPAKYRLSVVERLGLRRRLAQPTRMIVRNLERRPVKSFFTITGIAAACAILLMGGFYSDAVDEMVGLQLRVAQRDDLSVTFVEPAGRTALYSLSVLPSVEYVEPFRNVPVRIRHEHHQYRTSLRGVPGNSLLYRLLDDRLRRVDLEPGGVVLTDFLAKTLGIRVGDRITLEVLEGRRLSVQVPVTGTVKEYIGVFAYMRLEDIARLLREQESYSGAYLRTDPRFEPALLAELKGMPRVAGTAARLKMLNNFYETLAKQMLTFAFFNTLLAASIAFGVVYNSARIAFSERSRELASLRVLGFTRGEISYILLGEMALLTLAAIPPGFLLGHGLCRVMVAGMQNELFRIPVVISDWSHAFAAAVVLGSALVSAAIVRRKLDHLDLVAVLKTKE